MRQDITTLLPEEEDFLGEMMSIGSGWAATALTQLLGTHVETVIPTVKTGRVHECLPSAISDPGQAVTAVRMHMLGDCTGDMIFIVPDRDVTELVHRIQQADTSWCMAESVSPKHPSRTAALGGALSDMATSAITETANILVGVYLRAIYDFCRLSILHTTPVLANDMIQSILDESLSLGNPTGNDLVMVESQFLIGEDRVTSHLLMIPTAQSIKVLVNSIGTARDLCFGTNHESGK